MTIDEAEAIVGGVIAPMPLDAFFAAIEASTAFDALDGTTHPRARLFGDDPKATLLGGFATHAATLDCHAVAPTGPRPAPTDADGPEAFAALVAAYHDRNYTVRAPEVETLSALLLQFTRALEVLLLQPVTVSLFWSKAAARAKIHYDNNDIITVQLVGRKRWFVSTDPPGLQNPWRELGEPLPHLERHRVIDTGPGDLLYVPRGTPHSVISESESLHLSILFTPLTLRAAMIAVLDQLSDDDRALRETVTASRPDRLHDRLTARFGPAFDRLAAAARDPGYVAQALQRRSSRAVGAFVRHVPAEAVPSVTPDTRVRQTALGTVHLSNASPDVIDVAVPGGHIGLNAAARPALAFVATTAAFTVRDVPGLPPEHAAALVERLIAAGVLERG